MLNENEWVCFDISSNTVDDKGRSLILKLNKVLERMGGKIELVSTKHGEYLEIVFKEEEAEKFITRGAGRKEKAQGITIGEVADMMQKEPSEMVARWLGISVSTLYRRISTISTQYGGAKLKELPRDIYF